MSNVMHQVGGPHPLAIAIAALLIVPLPPLQRVAAQELPPGLTKDSLAKDNKLFITLASKALHWDEPTEPARIVGPLYYVGTRGLSSFLFVTSQGNILLNTGTPNSGPLIVQSIRKLGFKPEDIRVLINGHGHSDHAGAFAYFKQLTGAQLAIMEPDVAMIEDGGKSDFHYGKDWQIMGQPPVKVDRVLRDGDQVRLGEVVLTAHNTPGHTRGATTWVTTLAQDGKAYTVVFIDGGGFNPGYRLAASPTDYPGIGDDYRNTHHTHEMLRPDIWLGHHAEYFDYEGKRERAKRQGTAAWVDPEGYRRFVAKQKRAFEDEVDRELGAAPTARGESPAGLTGTAWRLVRFQGGDGAVRVPADPARYTLAFGDSGQVFARLDCNRGRGTWSSPGPAQLQFGPLALTRAMCQGDGLDQQLARHWASVRSYIVRDGHLVLSLVADGGTYEWEPDPAAKAAARPGP